MTLKPCVACGEPKPTDRARCPEHRPKDTKPSRQSRGYDAAWQRLSKRARRLQLFCTDCGSTEDLQTDHTPEAWQRKAEGKVIRLADIDVVCGRCNRRRGSARPETICRVAPVDTPQHPLGKAEFESLFEVQRVVALGIDDVGRPVGRAVVDLVAVDVGDAKDPVRDPGVQDVEVADGSAVCEPDLNTHRHGSSVP